LAQIFGSLMVAACEKQNWWELYLFSVSWIVAEIVSRGELCIVVFSFFSANNVPLISINGLNGSLTRQWTVLEESSLSFTTSDADNDAVTMYGWVPLPSDSTLEQVPNSDTMWTFTWTPKNMDPVELV